MREAELLSVQAAAKALRLASVSANASELSEVAAREHWGHLRYLAEVLQPEMDLRETRRAERLLAEARLPRTKLFSGFDISTSALSPEAISYLARGEFLETATSVVLIGGPGTGKSHLLIAGLAGLAGLGQRVRYVSAAAAVIKLAEAEDDARELTGTLEAPRAMNRELTTELNRPWETRPDRRPPS